MALVSHFPNRYPKSDLYLKEGCYGSKLHLRVNAETQCCDGTYIPPSPKKTEADGEDSAADQSEKHHGHAVLFGHVIIEPETNEYVLKGEWRHVQGPLHGGTFEMKLRDNGIGNGWWGTGHEEEERNPWEWSPELEPLTSTSGEEHVIQTRRASFSSMRSMDSILFTRSFSMRSSLSKRLDRSRSFFDELLESEGSSSVWIARWGVLCAWIFFYQTLAALIMSSLQITGEFSYVVQCVFQAVYTTTYMSFLVIYARMATKPPLDYVMGVFLYTLGYACFMMLYAVILMSEDSEAVTQATERLYLSGSLLFLVGSGMLVRATLPPPIVMVLRQLGFFEQVRMRFSVLDQQSSLFWGSITFLLGSCCFCLDSAWGIWDPESKPELLPVVSITAGYFVFTIGRLYFLWGSTTSECDAFFCRVRSDGSWGQCLCAAVSVLRTCCLGRKHSSKVAPTDSSFEPCPKGKGKQWLDLCEA